MMESRKRRSQALAALAPGVLLFLVLVAAGCYPGGPEDESDTVINLTFQSDTADYSGIMTYAMPDTVLPLNDPDDDSSSSLNRRYDRTILDGISAQLDAKGFQRIEEPDEANVPDVVVMVGSVETEEYLTYTYWGYPGWGWGYPGWGWGYGGYPYTGITRFLQGSVIWVMLDIRGLDASGDDPGEAQAIWVAGINGAARPNGPDPIPLIQNGIIQCFNQSPYIKADSSGN